MLPHRHALISASVGALGWWWTGKPAGFAAALLAGALPDGDHIVDYMVYRRYGRHRLILPLHGYEYAALGLGLALATRNLLFLTATLSYLIHLLADQRVNHTHKLGYSLLFRAWYHFRIEDISTVPEAAIQGRMDDMNLLKKFFRC